MERLTIDEVIEHCKKHTERMEKHSGRQQLEATPIGNSDRMKQYWEHKQVAKWLEKLKKYEQAEEDGLLIRPFCKIGDSVYEIQPLTNRITDRIIKSIVICNAPNLTIMYKSGYDYSILHEDFGKTVFLTEEEAEQALAKMKGEEE